ncbi:Protein C07B5.4 a [Aphelenchoides avenae]|nr:Protein C07B5.4 a [Aphelenchus avenae]
MLKFKTTQGTQAAAPSETADRKSSFVHAQKGHSNAAVVFRNVSIPLAWPAEEYFGYRKGSSHCSECVVMVGPSEFRSFTVQILWRTSDGRELFSRPFENVDRTFTDVNFAEEFRFENQPPDFCIEAIVYCRRTDEDAGVSVVQALSRSLGRSLGTSLKKYMQSTNTMSAAHLGRDENGNARTHFSPDYIENYRNPEKMCALGSARFRLRNATLSGRVHSYNLEVLVQPTSLGAPLGQGTMDIFFSDGGILLNNLHCVLQGGCIKCYRSEQMLQHGVQPSMSLPLNEMTKTEPSAFQTAIRLRLVDPESGATKTAMLIAPSHSSFLGWKSAINLQIMDCGSHVERLCQRIQKPTCRQADN